MGLYPGALSSSWPPNLPCPHREPLALTISGQVAFSCGPVLVTTFVTVAWPLGDHRFWFAG